MTIYIFLHRLLLYRGAETYLTYNLRIITVAIHRIRCSYAGISGHFWTFPVQNATHMVQYGINTVCICPIPYFQGLFVLMKYIL